MKTSSCAGHALLGASRECLDWSSSSSTICQISIIASPAGRPCDFAWRRHGVCYLLSSPAGDTTSRCSTSRLLVPMSCKFFHCQGQRHELSTYCAFPFDGLAIGLPRNPFYSEDVSQEMHGKQNRGVVAALRDRVAASLSSLTIMRCASWTMRRMFALSDPYRKAAGFLRTEHAVLLRAVDWSSSI